MKKQTKMLTAIVVVIIGLLALPADIYATACNTAGCWDGKVTLVRVDSAGRIWFVVDNSSQLTNLVPADGCVLKNIWAAGAVPALYITTSDPSRDEKYTMLLTALATNATVGFGPIKDPATGWCSLNNIDIQ